MRISTSSVLLVLILYLENVAMGCKKTPAPPPPKPRCKLPHVSKQLIDAGGWFTCSGHADPYYNVPKTSEDVAIQLTAKGGFIENGTLVIKDELAVPRKYPKTSSCHLICPPGLIPSPRSSTFCYTGGWIPDPATMLCTPSPCGVPTIPQHGKVSCFGNPSICYITCEPGYATMSNLTIVCRDRSWDIDPSTIQCEVAVALLIGGIGRARQVIPEYIQSCETMEVFSPVDEVCSNATLPLLAIGAIHHSSNLVNGEILLCGGNKCGSRDNSTLFHENLKESCFKMMDNNTWTLHSKLPQYGRMYHMAAIQQGQLQLIGNLHEPQIPVPVLQEKGWVLGRSTSLPPTAFPIYLGKPCTVVTSPTTYIVAGGSSDHLSEKRYSTVLEFNSLTGEWRALPSLPEGRFDHACALVTTKNGPGVMVAGGKNYDISEFQLESVYLLDLETEMWYPAGNLNRGREKMELVVLGEKVLVLGSYYFGKDYKHTSEEETVEEYVVPCPSLRECSPTQQGTWNLTERIIYRRSSLSVIPVPASRFNCTG